MRICGWTSGGYSCHDVTDKADSLLNLVLSSTPEAFCIGLGLSACYPFPYTSRAPHLQREGACNRQRKQVYHKPTQAKEAAMSALQVGTESWCPLREKEQFASP